MSLDRRTFVGTTASGALVASFGCRSSAAQRLDRRALVALAEVILPSDMSTNDLGRIADAFATWAEGIRPGTELLHGYGTGDIATADEDPVPRWTTQLTGLGGTDGARFAELSVDSRRALVGDALSGETRSALPAPQRARHVALALLAFYCEMPEATDKAYQASIRPGQCRPLAQSSQQPTSLT